MVGIFDHANSVHEISTYKLLSASQVLSAARK